MKRHFLTSKLICKRPETRQTEEQQQVSQGNRWCFSFLNTNRASVFAVFAFSVTGDSVLSHRINEALQEYL